MLAALIDDLEQLGNILFVHEFAGLVCDDRAKHDAIHNARRFRLEVKR
jgi:hypothetical protein